LRNAAVQRDLGVLVHESHNVNVKVQQEIRKALIVKGVGNGV